MKQFRSQEKAPYKPAGSVSNKPLWQRVAHKLQLGRRARMFIWTVTKRRLENVYRSEEGTGSRLDRPVDPKAISWERRNFQDFVLLPASDGVLPILVSQATVIHPDKLNDPTLRSVMMDAPSMVGMTLPLIASTWQQVNKTIEDVARQQNAIFVDGYRAVPGDTNHLIDHVHLHDRGCDALAEEITRVLTGDPQFQKLVDRVRHKTATATSAR
jgi:hypothetical protein